jgi:hypothetical protein
MSEDTRYNGWSNYETWAVALWLDNEPYYLDAALECVRDGEYTEPCVDADNTIRDTVYDLTMSSPEGEDIVTGLAADLLGAALSSVDWREVTDMVFESYADELDIDSDEYD